MLQPHPPKVLNGPNAIGVYVAAIKTYIIMWSNFLITLVPVSFRFSKWYKALNVYNNTKPAPNIVKLTTSQAPSP